MRLLGPFTRRHRNTSALDVPARHSEMSIISSADDLLPQPNTFLLDTLVSAASIAPTIDLSLLLERCGNDEDRTFVRTWPGEHYRLLPALVEVTGAQHVIEIGTYRGHGALALHLAAPQVTTYDIAPYTEFTDSALCPQDFSEGIEQRIGDLSSPQFFDRELDELRQAQLIFVDGPKDGRFERSFAQLLTTALAGSNTLVIWDDIRVMSMIAFWRWLPVPKLDATSFGHWSGTGLSQLT